MIRTLILFGLLALAVGRFTTLPARCRQAHEEMLDWLGRAEETRQSADATLGRRLGGGTPAR